MNNGQVSFNPDYLERIARVCHEANRSHCEAIGDMSQKSWDEAEQWQRDSAIKGVAFRINNPNAPESAQHDAWMADKIADGWIYGEEKNAELKTHHCIVPFEQLPYNQQLKDKIFCNIVDVMTGKYFIKLPVTGYHDDVVANKQLRKVLDEKIQILSKLPKSRERSLSITKLEEAVMWLGMDLKRLGEKNPYPSSKDPNTGAAVEPTADGLKFSN